VEFTRKHTGRVGEALGDIRRIVEGLVRKRDERKDGFVGLMRKAMETKAGGDADESLKLLAKHGFSRALAARAVEIAHEKHSRFTIGSASSFL
jgi:hypothetical protein